MFCTSCGMENVENAKFCTSCGKTLNIGNNEESLSEETTNPYIETENDDYENKMLQAFIGKPDKVAYYSDAFKKFESHGFQWNWSWWGFFGSIFFLLYRKVYLVVGIMLLLICANVVVLLGYDPKIYQVVNFAFNIALGGISAFLIFLRYKKLKSEIESKTSDSKECLALMKEAGGVMSLWKIMLTFVLFILLFMSFALLSEAHYGKSKTTTEASQNHDPIKINQLEVYYTNAVTKDEASDLANYLAKVNYGTETGATVQLNKEAGIYQCRMVILPSFIDDPENIKNMQVATIELSNDVFNGNPVDIHFCDDQMNTKRIISFKNNN